MEDYIYSFEKLEVWKKAKDLTVYLYKMTDSFPLEEKYGVVSQIRRASFSIGNNLAEGSSRSSRKDQAHFYTLAYSSAIELLNHLIVCCEIGFLSVQSLNECRMKIEKITLGVSRLKKATIIQDPAKQSQPSQPSQP